MPRYLLRRTEAQRAYRREQGKPSYNVQRAAARFIDYFRLQGASLPEMMVYAELVRRNVPFAYAKYFGDIPFTKDVERFRPDFTLEEYRIIIRVQGMYWHTRPGDAENDARQAALYVMLGWKVYDLWEDDIFRDVKQAVDKIPELIVPAILGSPEPTIGRIHNVMAGMVARLRGQPKVLHKKYRARPGGKPRVVRGWFPRREHAPFEIDYVPIRFVGWEEEPEKWPGADKWWEERDKARKEKYGPMSAPLQSWEDLSKTAGRGFEELGEEFNRFPAGEQPVREVAEGRERKEPDLLLSSDFWLEVQEQAIERAEAGTW